MSLLEIQHLGMRYENGIQALEDVSFSVFPGQTIGLLGENGAGKTTCLRILAGLLHPTSGQVLFDGVGMYPCAHRLALRIGFMPAGLMPDLRVSEVLDFRARLCGFKGSSRARELDRLLELCQATAFSRRFTGSLSTGMRQRVALAWALCGSPELVLLDEPSFGLDPRQQEALRTIISEAAHTSAVIVSSHGLDELARIASRFVILHRGRLLHDGEAEGNLLEFFLRITNHAPNGEART